MESIFLETIDQFNHDLRRILGNNYIDILLYGSSTINSFTPHSGDIDFVVLVNENLNDNEIGLIFDLHDYYRTKELMNLAYQLEGMYYPISVLKDNTLGFIGCYIGTGRKGWKKITKFQNNVFDLIQMKNNGISYFKKKYDIYEPNREEVRTFIVNEINRIEKLIDEKSIPSHFVVQFVARTIYYIDNEKIGSKRESCERYSEKKGKNEYIKVCGEVKDNYKETEEKYQNHRGIAKEAIKDLCEMVELKEW